jgi:hypothetical protein
MTCFWALRVYVLFQLFSYQVVYLILFQEEKQ